MGHQITCLCFFTTTTATKRRPFAARVPSQPCGWTLPVVAAVLASTTTAQQCARFHASLKRRLFPTLVRTPRTPSWGAGGQQATYAFSAHWDTSVVVGCNARARLCCNFLLLFISLLAQPRPPQKGVFPGVAVLVAGYQRKAAQRWKLWVFWGHRERPSSWWG